MKQCRVCLYNTTGYKMVAAPELLSKVMKAEVHVTRADMLDFAFISKQYLQFIFMAVLLLQRNIAFPRSD